MKGLKIGFVFDDSLDRTDGIQQYITTVGRWLIEQGHDVHFLVGQTETGPFPQRTQSLSKNFAVHGNGNKLSIPLPANKRRIKAILEREQFDVLHVQVPYNPLLGGRIITLAPATTAVVGTFHITAEDRLTNLGARFMGFAQQRSLARFDTIVSVSDAAHNFARRNYRIESEVLPNTVSVPKRTTPTESIPGRIVFLGRLVERKGCAELIKALSLMSSERDIELVICGDGEERTSLEALSRKLGLSDRIRFLGMVSEKEKYHQLAQAELAVFPSLHGESFGIVLLEAMAMHNPIVLAGDNPGYRSVLGEQADQVLVDPTDHKIFVRRMETLLSDRQLRQTLHQWQQKLLDRYTIESVGPRIERLYHSTLAD